MILLEDELCRVRQEVPVHDKGKLTDAVEGDEIPMRIFLYVGPGPGDVGGSASE